MNMSQKSQDGCQSAKTEAVESLFTRARWRELGEYLRLTPRQLAVARLICADCRISDMACQLGLSRDTVGSHLKALYKRLGAQSRVGVVVRLVRAARVLDGRMPPAPGGRRGTQRRHAPPRRPDSRE